jgi:hypothetical protein
MADQATLTLIEILGKTLEHLENNGDANDAAHERLKHSLLLAIAELELIAVRKTAA